VRRILLNRSAARVLVDPPSRLVLKHLLSTPDSIRKVAKRILIDVGRVRFIGETYYASLELLLPRPEVRVVRQ